MTISPTDHRRAQLRTVGVLSAAQILGGLGVGAGVAVGGLLAEGVMGSEAAAGLASTASVVGAAAAALPLARLTDRFGRRLGLSTGLGLATLGALLVVVGASTMTATPLFAGFLLTGAGTAAGLQARYAATDLASEAHRARDLSTVVWATTVGAVAGPNLADPTGRWALALGLPELTGAYLLALGAFVLATATILLGLRPDPLLLARLVSGAAASAVHRVTLASSWRTARRSPGAMIGLGAVVVAHTTMVSVMVMTPVHMHHVDVELAVIGIVLSVHITGMYALSPVVGLLSDRLGRRPVLVLGAALLLAACLISGTAAADDALRLGIGLFLLGLGWSCGLVAGSTLLTESVPVTERPGVQGMADLAMNVSGAMGGVVAGIVVAVTTYGWLTAVAAVPVAMLLAVLLRRTGPTGQRIPRTR